MLRQKFGFRDRAQRILMRGALVAASLIGSQQSALASRWHQLEIQNLCGSMSFCDSTLTVSEGDPFEYRFPGPFGMGEMYPLFEVLLHDDMITITALEENDLAQRVLEDASYPGAYGVFVPGQPRYIQTDDGFFYNSIAVFYETRFPAHVGGTYSVGLPVPEPATWLLMALGVLGIAAASRKSSNSLTALGA